MVTFAEPRRVELVAIDDLAPGAGEVAVRTLYSGISAGTELTGYRGTSPHLTGVWDPELRLFTPGADAAAAYPVRSLGYEEVGEVSALGAGVDALRVGDRIWGTWGHRSTALLAAEQAAARRLPPGVDPRIGVFSHIGAVALNAVLDADIHVGETVAVFGLGVPGQLAAQLARANGAKVVAVDGIAARRELATRLGADVVLDPVEDAVAERIREITDGRGADVAIEFTGSARAVHEAIRSVAPNSRVCVAGFLQGDAVGLRLGEEFHHNRVQLVSSQISAPGPHVQHRWDRMRLWRTAIELAATGRLDVLPLISAQVPVRRAAAAYAALDERPAEAMQVLLDFGASP